MQTPAQTPTPTPPLPRPPVSITTVGSDGQATTLTIPSTFSEVRALLARREQLSEQLLNVTARRRDIAEEVVAAADVNTRTGLEERLRLLDNRILQLETDLATTGRQLASTPAELIETSETQVPAPGDDFEEGLMIGGGAALFFMAVVLFFARRRWKSARGVARGQMGSESSQRLERLEQGMDAIAIEIERVSEGQRFVTKLLSESHSPAAGARQIGEPALLEADASRKR